MASLISMTFRACYHLYQIYHETHLNRESLRGFPLFFEENHPTIERITNVLRDFLNIQGIRNDLVIGRYNGPGQAFGTNYFTGGEAIIALSPMFYINNENGMIFTAKHEIAHIKNNDLFKFHLLTVICSLSVMIFSFCFLPVFTWHIPNIPNIPTFFLLIFTYQWVVNLISLPYIYYAELRADNFAIANSSADELRGGIEFFELMLAVNKNRRTSFMGRLIYSESGDDRHDLPHPYLTNRIQKIRNELVRRGESISGNISAEW